MGLLKKLLLLIVGGTTSLIIAACYGVQGMYDAISVRVNAKDQDGEAISGLEVRSNCDGTDYQTVYTDTEGDAYLGFDQSVELDNCTAELVDVDGVENGGEFESKTVPLHSGATEVFVTMEPVPAD